MSTAMTVYEQVKDPLQFIKEVGQAIHTSGMFGATGPAQGQMLAMECMVKGLPPLSLAERYHIIEGKLSMKADAMLAAFRHLGGEHEQLQRNEDGAEIELSMPSRLTKKVVRQKFKLTWAEAQKEPFPYGSGGKLKKNWASPRARMQMMWARVVSDGVRAMAPEVVAGYYTPEELGGESTDDEPAQQPPATGEVIDAEYEVDQSTESTATISTATNTAEQPEKEATAAPQKPTNAESQSAPFDPTGEYTLERISPAGIQMLSSHIANAIKAGVITKDQARERIEHHAGGAGRKMADLTPNAATALQLEVTQLIRGEAKIETIHDAQVRRYSAMANTGVGGNTAAAESGRVSQQSQPPAPVDTNGHVTKTQLEQIRTTITDLAKDDPNQQAKVDAVVKRLGKSRLEELTKEEGGTLLDGLYVKASQIARSKATAKN